MAGFPLTGVDPQDPTPGIIRDLIFAQNASGGGGSSRDVVLLGNKTSAGSETVNTLNGEVVDSNDMEARVGRRSELNWMYRVFRAIDKTARVYFIAVTEAGTASTFTLTVANAATDTTTAVIEWGGETMEMTINSGDSVASITDALAAKINANLYWPFTASSDGVSVVTVTTANTGVRSVYVANPFRVTLRKAITTTITKSAVAAGATEDDFTTAYSVLNTAGTFFYQVSAKTAITTVTATDNGIGEHLTNIASQALPNPGKGQIGIFGLVSTQANATLVGVSAPANSVYAVFVRAENNPWFPGMLAAHVAAVKRNAEIVDPGANLTGYTVSDTTQFLVPPPYDKTDYPTDTEIRADLNNGITPITFSASGTPSIVRQITGKNWTNSASTKDYRAREGHIPSVVLYLWEVVRSRYAATKQGRVAADPPRGQKPLPGTTTPGAVKALIQNIIDDYTFGNANGAGPLLDPTVYQAMQDSVDVRLLTDGISAHVDWVAVRHNNKGQFQIAETSLAS
jgi:phage tail sheath gpL-like